MRAGRMIADEPVRFLLTYRDRDFKVPSQQGENSTIQAFLFFICYPVDLPGIVIGYQ